MLKHLRLIALLAIVLTLPAVFTSQVAEEDARTIMRGFCDGLDIDADIVPDAYIEGDDVADVITLLSAENNRFALKGLKKLGSVLSRVPDVIQNNGGNEGADTLYLEKLQKLATDLENIDAYEPADNNNLTVMGVSIVGLVNNATNQLNSGAFLEAGMSMGMALHHIYTATQPPVSEEIIAEVQTKAEEQGWTPGEVPAELTGFENIDAFAKAKLGVKEEEHTAAVAEMRRQRRLGIEPEPIYARQTYPANFDPRTKWPNCIHGGRSQEVCGSCWAFAGTNALSDRFCIASNGKINKYFSPQQMLECEKKSDGCDGGYEKEVFEYAKRDGVFQESCFPYASAQGRILGRCPAKCQDGSTPNKFYVSEVLYLRSNVNDIKYQLMNFGPLTTGMTVYQDFQVYKGGIYSHVSGGKGGGHAVKLIGWGYDDKTRQEYWICANSWGTNWGENGFFRIRFGDSDILTSVGGATPDIQRSITTNNNGADIPGEDAGGDGQGGKEFGGTDNNPVPVQPDQPIDDGGDTGGDDGWGDWGNWDDWGSGGGDDSWGDWGNWDDWGSGKDDGGSSDDSWGDWGNWDDWGSDWGNNDGGSNDDWGNWDDWGSDWGNAYDNWGSGNNDDWSNWDNWSWRRNSKSGVIAQGLRQSVRKNGPRPLRRHSAPQRGPVRRRGPPRRRSVSRSPASKTNSNMVNIVRKASAQAGKSPVIRRRPVRRSVQRRRVQAHHIKKP